MDRSFQRVSHNVHSELRESEELYVVFSIRIFSVYGLTLYNSFGHVAHS